MGGERAIDTERAGGTGDVAPKRKMGAAPMTHDEAKAYVVTQVRWRAVRSKAEQALIAFDDAFDDALEAALDAEFDALEAALDAEVNRLRGEIAGNAELERRESAAWREAYKTEAAELSRLRSALPEVIGCSNRMGAECKLTAWMPCCLTRERMVRAGLLPQPERQDCEDPA